MKFCAPLMMKKMDVCQAWWMSYHHVPRVPCKVAREVRADHEEAKNKDRRPKTGSRSIFFSAAAARARDGHGERVDRRVR